MVTNSIKKEWVGLYPGCHINWYRSCWGNRPAVDTANRFLVRCRANGFVPFWLIDDKYSSRHRRNNRMLNWWDECEYIWVVGSSTGPGVVSVPGPDIIMIGIVGSEMLGPCWRDKNLL